MSELDQLQEWVGNTEETVALITAEQANLMQAILSRAPNLRVGDALPPGWHWLYFHEAVGGDDLGEEGHPKLGGFLPPVPLPRRMWAGGKLLFKRPLRLGETATKRSTVHSITPKSGRSGQLIFVVVRHEILVEGEVAVAEEQTLVYREAAAVGKGAQSAAAPAPYHAEFSHEITPNPILLFRYSALTFNAHRIHYDVDYCRQQEGYPDLVVHGPLTATLLLDLFYRRFPERTIVEFDYRGRSPLFNPQPFTVNGTAEGELWAANHQGGLAMTGKIAFK